MSQFDYQAAARWLQNNDHFLVVSHVNPDGDATGSLLAVAQILSLMGKKGRLVNEGSTLLVFPSFPALRRLSIRVNSHSSKPMPK
jgi:phosphoesterase RecJ-like protein